MVPARQPTRRADTSQTLYEVALERCQATDLLGGLCFRPQHPVEKLSASLSDRLTFRGLPPGQYRALGEARDRFNCRRGADGTGESRKPRLNTRAHRGRAKEAQSPREDQELMAHTDCRADSGNIRGAVPPTSGRPIEEVESELKVHAIKGWPPRKTIRAVAEESGVEAVEMKVKHALRRPTVTTMAARI